MDDYKILLSSILATFIVAFAGVQAWSSFAINPQLHYSSQANLPALSDISDIFKDFDEKDYELIVDEQSIPVNPEEINSFIELYDRDYTKREEIRVSANTLANFLIDIAQGINQQPINARITFVDGEPTALYKEIPGKELDINASAEEVVKGLMSGETSINLVVNEIEPILTVDTFKKLKINSLLSVGQSNFYGSSNARIHNIKTGSAKYNGYLIPPETEFSFNDILGAVDASTGYLPELVIKNKKVIPEYGGGICQVSTTLFRAALNAGLPITERRNHSFPVSYYSPQGLDATIYPGVQDLKFFNDTGEYVLIQTYIEGTKIFFELYGNDDGRVVRVFPPKQYPRDNGALYTTVYRTVEKGDDLTENVFSSYYKNREEFPLERNPLE